MSQKRSRILQDPRACQQLQREKLQIQTEIETLDVENIDKIQPAGEERADVEEKARGNHCH